MKSRFSFVAVSMALTLALLPAARAADSAQPNILTSIASPRSPGASISCASERAEMLVQFREFLQEVDDPRA